MDSNLTHECPAIAVERLAALARAIVRPNTLTLIAIASALLTIAVRLPFLDWPLTVDEAGYAYGARWWSEGVSLYSDEMWFDRPQGIFVVYRIGMSLLGESTEAMRIHGALWSAATTALVVMIAARMFDRRIALVTGLLFAVVSGASHIEGFVANAEIFMLTAATASAYLVWGKHWFAAGLLAGVAITLKPSGGAALLLAAWWLIHERQSFRAWVVLAIGTSLPLTAALAHGIASAGLYDYAYATLLFRLQSGGSSAFLPSVLYGVSRTFLAWVPLAVAAALGWRNLTGSHPERAFLTVWLITSLFGMAMGGNWWPHYFLQFIPPLTLLAIAGFAAAARKSDLSPTRFVAVGLTVTVFAYAMLVWPAASLRGEQAVAGVFPDDHYLLNEQVGIFLRDHTEPTDQIYVAVAQADIVYTADRLSVVPYLYRQQLVEMPGASDLVVERIEQRTAAYVVVLPWQFKSGSERAVRLLAAIEAGYTYDRAFGDIEVWVRR